MTSTILRTQLTETAEMLDRVVMTNDALSIAVAASLSECLGALRRSVSLHLSARSRYQASMHARSCFVMAPKKIDKTHGGLLTAIADLMAQAEGVLADDFDALTDR